MIRYIWVSLVIGAATLACGLAVIGAALLRVRGPFYARATQAWGRAILWASGTRVVVHGAERVDWKQPQVLVSNHIAGYDIFALAATIPAVFHFVGKKELNSIPFFGHAWRAAGHISIDRSDRASAIASLRQAGEKIRRDRAVVIVFPEGTRSRTGELQSFKKGAFLLALEAQVPVVPVVVAGSDRVHPRGSFRIRPLPIHLHYCDPIPTAGMAPNRSDVLIEQVRERMLEVQRALRERA